MWIHNSGNDVRCMSFYGCKWIQNSKHRMNQKKKKQGSNGPSKILTQDPNLDQWTSLVGSHIFMQPRQKFGNSFVSFGHLVLFIKRGKSLFQQALCIPILKKIGNLTAAQQYICLTNVDNFLQSMS
jgi:hypothetical protein